MPFTVSTIRNQRTWTNNQGVEWVSSYVNLESDGGGGFEDVGIHRPADQGVLNVGDTVEGEVTRTDKGKLKLKEARGGSGATPTLRSHGNTRDKDNDIRRQNAIRTAALAKQGGQEGDLFELADLVLAWIEGLSVGGVEPVAVGETDDDIPF